MKKIPSFQEFEINFPLHEKISPDLAESISKWFSEDERLNEASFMDSVKNFLSKTFLGSLSYMNIIDKVRSEVLKLEKEVITKKYKYQDEVESLQKDFKDMSSKGDESSASKIKKTLDLKTQEFKAYEKMTTSRINKALEALNDAIKGNKRRREYYEAGKSQDDLDLAEFEYSMAKKRASIGTEELRKLEEEIRKAKEEATRAEESMEKFREEAAEEKDAEKSKKEIPGPPDFKKSFRSVTGTREAIIYLEGELSRLRDKIHDTKRSELRQALQNEIRKVEKDLALAKDVLAKLKSKNKRGTTVSGMGKVSSQINSAAATLNQNARKRSSSGSKKP